jgi:hypothetical protein
MASVGELKREKEVEKKASKDLPERRIKKKQARICLKEE